MDNYRAKGIVLETSRSTSFDSSHEIQKHDWLELGASPRFETAN